MNSGQRISEGCLVSPSKGVDRTFAINDLDPDESPIARLQRRGPRSLSDSEVLSLIAPEESSASHALLKDIGLEGVSKLDERYLLCSSHSSAAAAALIGAVELARRLARMRIPERIDLYKPDVVANYLALRYQGDQEVFGALFLDAQQRLIVEREIYRGTLTRASVEPRAVLKTAILCDARSFIAFHTHPSGDPSPSQDDIGFTRLLADAAQIVGVNLDDHLIIGSGGRSVSLKARGAF